MRFKVVLVCTLAAVIALSLGFQYSDAASGTDQSLIKIGKVNVRTVLRDCPRNAKYREQVIAEQTKIQAELVRLGQQEQALEAGLAAFTPGTTDYVEHLEELMNKQAEMQVKENLSSQQRLAKDHRWTEDLYKEILATVQVVAAEKNLDLVLESDEPDFPLPSSEELMMALRTHKLLYTRSAVDITADVLARLSK